MTRAALPLQSAYPVPVLQTTGTDNLQAMRFMLTLMPGATLLTSGGLCNPQPPLDDLVRDFANPRTTGDRFFPFARQKDWFDGHSWASGYTVFAAGKNQVQSRTRITHQNPITDPETEF